ncbi:MAG: hypothetical protein RIF32_03815 [Leptospirales bacterium]
MKSKPRRLILFAFTFATILFVGAWLAFDFSPRSPDRSPGPLDSEAPAAPELRAPDWYALRNYEGLAFVTRRRAGIDHLIIYAGRSADAGDQELGPAAPLLLDGGFDLITHRRTVGDKPESERAPEDASLDDEGFREFLELATARPGYRKRILILHGRRLRAGLEYLAGTPRSVATVIVLRPGDAIRDRAAVVAAALLLPEELRFLWIPSGQGRETANANAIQNALLRANISPSITRLDSPGLFSGGPSEFRLRLNESLYYELLMERIQITWRKATDVFKGGCGFAPNGARRIYTGNVEVSGDRDEDFCPLFIRRRPGQALVYRAEEVNENYCGYRMADGRTRLFCAYESDDRAMPARNSSAPD